MFCLFKKIFFPKATPGVFFSVKQTQYVGGPTKRER